MALIDIAQSWLTKLPPETAHDWALRGLRWGPALGLAPKSPPTDDPRLAVRVLDLDFPNPIGLAAGFDKNAEVFAQILSLGFGFTEVGSITPKPQPGNPKPRLFRAPAQQAIINRMGFNNAGAAAAEARLARRGWGARDRAIGVNLGKNKTSADAAADYALGAKTLSPHADYLVVNVSSPNTPGLRALQDPTALTAILQAVSEARQVNGRGVAPPVLVKLAPDLTDDDIAEIARFVASAAESGLLHGLIVSNTTLARPDGLDPAQAAEAGGLSGAPLFTRSTEALRALYRRTDGALPIIGVGGVGSGAEAYAKIRAGASLVQVYSAFAYQGPTLIGRIKSELVDLMKADGHTRIAQAIGADA
ncbi:MAG: quinone-dependent dihydroorotate dehydrogenase [Alphaproteobacteria bacterium]|nr:quinone-dependent dihydroorotate dehydrogenase [Alphaproteobacteria bacterium]